MSEKPGILKRLEYYADCIDKGIHVTGSQLKRLVLDIRERGGVADANVAHATAAQAAEIEALRVRADAMAGEAIKHEARAERLAEALQKLAAHVRPTCSVLWEEAQAALRDHDQEVGNG